MAKDHLGRIEFAPIPEWETVHVFKRTSSDGPRSRPYKIAGRWYQVGGERSLFVFGPAAQKPFGLLPDTQKRATGTIALRIYQDDR